MMGRPAVELLGAVKRHRDGACAFELHVPVFCVQPGEVCTICGTSGCGKTTFLDAVGCMSPFDSCNCFNIGGVDMANASASTRLRVRGEHMGYVQQQGGLIPFLTARENMRLPLQIANCPAFDERIGALAAMLGIADQLDKQPSSLSVGQRQRVSIARALVHRPRVVLADEPTGALDPVNAREVCALLVRAAKEQGTAVIIVTHDEALFRPVSDSVFGFRLGGSGSCVLSTMEPVARRREVPTC